MASVHPTGRVRRRRGTAEINIVPYIDVMLVLLVIFMVTAPLLTQGVDVQLPETSAEPIHSTDQPVTLSIDAQGRYFLDIGTDKDRPIDGDEIEQRVGAVLRNKPETMVLVRADRAASYGEVAVGMTALQAAGAKKIGFVTDAPQAPAASGKRQHGRS
ncbi:MAG: protein TolR [Nevskiaceae bacterium]|nr:MAG: protein TolR [Nevskiaceae bacterium]TBR74077.1 MAG: protein TolR [Nevskiaceae bacterium]